MTLDDFALSPYFGKAVHGNMVVLTPFAGFEFRLPSGKIIHAVEFDTTQVGSFVVDCGSSSHAFDRDADLRIEFTRK